MKVINRKIQDSPISFGFDVYEYTIELDNGKIIYFDMYKEDHDEKLPYEETECWAYTVPFEEITDEPDKEEYYDCSEGELKEIYNFCLEN